MHRFFRTTAITCISCKITYTIAIMSTNMLDIGQGSLYILSQSLPRRTRDSRR